MSNSKKPLEKARRCLLCKKELLPDDWKFCDDCARKIFGNIKNASKVIVPAMVLALLGKNK